MAAGDATERGIEGLEGDLARQVASLGERAPSYRALLGHVARLLAEEGPRALLASAWADRSFTIWYERPLLLLAALRAEARADPSHPLHAAIGREPPEVEAATLPAARAALAGERLAGTLRTRTVQTNETSRAVAWTWPRAPGAPGPGALFDVGASAGLNLTAERRAAPWREPSGAPLQVVSRLDARLRLGLDAAPLDVRRELPWLEACVWPGEPERLARLEAAARAFLAAQGEPAAPRVERCDAADAPARIVAEAAALPGDTLVVAYQTVMREYLPGEVRARYLAGMEALVASRPPGATLWLELESGPPSDAGPAALVAHVRGPDGVRALPLARCGYHPSVVTPDEAAVAALVAAAGRRG